MHTENRTAVTLVLLDSTRAAAKFRSGLLMESASKRLPWRSNADRVKVGEQEYVIHLYRDKKFVPLDARPTRVISIGVDEEMHSIAETLAIFHEVSHNSSYRLCVRGHRKWRRRDEC